MTSFKTLGDPHLGRKFRTGVPLHRIGEREVAVWNQFEEEISNPGDVEFHINMGDLFDKFIVPPEVVLRAAHAYRVAADRNRKVHFVVIRGNHDAQKDSIRRSSFDIFTQLVRDIPNLTVVGDTPVEHEGMGFVPYDPFRSAEDLVGELSNDLDRVFGHWDVVDFGSDNVIPTKLLAAKKIKVAYTGHDHLAREETRHGVDITVTGSMQPYTHAEDNTGEWYQTVTLDEIPEDCRDLNLRVILKDGEDLPEDLDALSVIAKRVSSDEEALEADTDDFEKFDIRGALSEALHPEVREEVMEQFDA